MTIAELKNTIASMTGAINARTNKTNFIAVTCEDGVAKVEIKTALAKDTKNHTAFDLDAAVEAYKAWEAENALKAAERASKPKVAKGPNPEAQARRDALDAAIVALPSFTQATATDVWNQLPESVKPKVVMPVGQALKRLVESGAVATEVITLETESGKPKNKTVYTKG